MTDKLVDPNTNSGQHFFYTYPIYTSAALLSSPPCEVVEVIPMFAGLWSLSFHTLHRMLLLSLLTFTTVPAEASGDISRLDGLLITGLHGEEQPL